ncbi:piggyBac transposable element-derived protein 3-like [Thunnus thynnus]|uniref:piggyBac transposable element-derived protein 3-like n=1 Tax=Thunnus thynnus TaxID=8237 RepID=UPI0035271ACB
MQPAKRGLFFSVQDVIVAIQESEIESDDTDASDGEADGDAGEMDKENQKPTDCPASDHVDIKPQPSKQTMPRDRYRWLKKDFISPNTDFSGLDVTNYAVSLHTPQEYFQKFVSEDMIEALTRNTNEEKCLKVVPEEHNSMDEMMIPFKRKFSNIKQYMRGKPHPWGFKLWVRTGISGMLCDFDVYQGSVNGIQAKSEFGLSGDVVMKLASTFPEGQNYKIYADNYFTCVPLIGKLLDHGIHYVGTARKVRLPNCNLEDENSLKKKGRGSFDIRVEGNHNICPVKWYDNRAVTLVSSCAGPEPVQKIQCWDKVTKTYTEVERPYIVGTYNKYMGGVDLLDSFAAKHKFPMKSYHWYIYIFWHTIILAVINAWLLHKWDCKALKISKKEMLNRRQFQAQLASSLILVNTTLNTPKKGRPSSSNGSPVTQTVTSRSPFNAQKRPLPGHWSPQNGAPAKRSSVHPPLDVRKEDLILFSFVNTILSFFY